MARTNGDLVPGITAYADGPDQMREVSVKVFMIYIVCFQIADTFPEFGTMLAWEWTTSNYPCLENL